MEFREFIKKPFVVYEDEQPDAPQPEQPKGNIIQPDKRLIQPKKQEPILPKIIKSDENFPNSPLRDDKGNFFEGKMPAQKMREFDPVRRLHQMKHFLHDNYRLGYNMDRDQLESDFDEVISEGNDPVEWGMNARDFFEDNWVPEFDETFHEMIDQDGKRNDKIKELMDTGMDEDDAYDQAVDFVEEMKGNNESYFGRYYGMRNYIDVNNFLRHGIPDDTEFPLDGTLYELGWGNGLSSSWYETKAKYPYYDRDKDDWDEDENSDLIERYENEVAEKKSNAIAALVHIIKKMEAHIDEQDEMPGEMLYRGLHTGNHDLLLDSDPFKDLQIGDIIRDPGFMSTSRDRKIAEKFAREGDSRGALMEIFGGGKYKDLSAGSESELVFPPLTQLKYLGQGDDGRYMFDMDGFDRNDIQESVKLTKPRISKLMKQLSDDFKARMNDFQFEVLKQEEPEQEVQKPKPKQFRNFIKKYIDIDD